MDRTAWVAAGWPEMAPRGAVLACAAIRASARFRPAAMRAVSLALIVGLNPGQALGLGGDGDCSGVPDQVERFFDFCFGLGGFGLDFGGDAPRRDGRSGVCPGDAGL